MSSPRKSPSGSPKPEGFAAGFAEQAELRSGAGSEPPPGDEDKKGIGAYISYAVLATILVVVLGIALHLHAFWWQS